MAEIDPQVAQMMQQFTQALGNMNLALEKAGINVTKFAGNSVKTVESQFKKLDQELKAGTKQFKNIGPELQELQKQISLETDAKKRASLQNDLLSKSQQAMVAVLKDGAMQVAGLAASAFGSYYKQQVMVGLRGVMGEGSPFQVAADLQTAAIDSGIKATQGLVGIGTTVGTALMMIPTPATILAGTLTVLGSQIFGKIAGEAAELMKFQVEVTSKAIEKTYKAFQQASSAGALFAGGITELRNTAIEAGVGQQQFSAIIANNSAAMAQFGGDVALGAKRLAAVSAAGMGARQSLLNLGISIEDQVQGTADYMAMLQRTGNLRGKSDQELAKESETYLVNMKALSAITGEDAKSAKARAEEAAKQNAVRSQLANLDAGASEKFRGGIALLGKGNEQIIQQMMVFGEVQGEQAQALANMPALDKAIRQYVTDIKDPSVSLEQAMTRFRSSIMANQPEILAQVKLTSDTMAAVQMLTGQFSGSMSIVTTAFDLGTADFTKALESPADAAKTAKDTQDDFTKSVTAGVVKLNLMSIAIDDMMSGPIKRFADDVPKILEGFRKKLVELGFFKEEKPPAVPLAGAPSGVGKNTVLDPTQLANATELLRGSDLNERDRRWLSDLVARQPGANQSLPDMVSLPQVQSIIDQAMNQATPQATGGVLKPRRGGQMVLAAEAGLHEAFVPLPDGKTIPVSLNVELTQLLKDNNVAITNVSKDMRDAIQTMLRNSGVTDTTSQDQLVTLMTQFLEAQREAKREMEDQTQALRRLYDAYA